MNPNLSDLHPYPFEKLAQLKHGITPPDKAPIVLSIGEPAHATPEFIKETLVNNLQGLSNYPTTKGIPALRQAIAAWLVKRFKLPDGLIDPETQVLPVSGTREALFSFAQCIVDASTKPVVVMPNPFYQIYEGAALLAGAEAYFLNTTAETGYLPDFDPVPEAIWQRCQLLYVCSPGNPSGAVLDQAGFEKLLALAEKYDFVIASDECYSELYDDEAQPPVGLLQVAYAMGNTAFKRCVVFHSLSKRSNAPGMRSGFVAGDADILQPYFQYRTYQGCAMPLPTQYASIKAWQDELHVVENRRLYREKFEAVLAVLGEVCGVKKPAAGFYVWLKIPPSPLFSKGGAEALISQAIVTDKAASLKNEPKSTASFTNSPEPSPPFEKGGPGGILKSQDTLFAQQLFAHENVTVLPGSYLSREFNGSNPGENHVRIALVAPLADCIDAAHRIKNFITTQWTNP